MNAIPLHTQPIGTPAVGTSTVGTSTMGTPVPSTLTTNTPVINHVTDTSDIYDAAYFRTVTKEAIGSRRLSALKHPEFEPLFSDVKLDLHTAISNEHLTHIAKAIARTIDQFQTYTREFGAQIREASIAIFEHIPDLSLDSKIYTALISTAGVTRQLTLMESFLTDLITHDSSPIRLLNILPDASFDATGRKFLRVILKEGNDLIRGAANLFIPATERAQSELLNIAHTIRDVDTSPVKSQFDTLSLARAHVAIGSALTTLEIGLFSLNAGTLRDLTKHSG